MAYEDVERLQPCECGSTRFCFDGRDWQCVRCEPSALESPIRVELRDEDSRGDSGSSRWPSVSRMIGSEVTAGSVERRVTQIQSRRADPGGEGRE